MQSLNVIRRSNDEAVKATQPEPGQVWKGRHTVTELRIIKVWDNSVTVTDLKGQNQRGLSIADLLKRYKKEA